jgi:dihydrofolate synthase / folylpolyglutamate synthase
VTNAEAVAWLSQLSPSIIRLGLDRVQAALAALKNPQTKYPAIHVAGTNGKGSTCAFAAACLQQQGYRVGLYTSPHLVRINERFQVGGVPIEDDVLGKRVNEVLAIVGPDHALTFFEFGTVVALWHFAQEKIDVAVLETGLGGRLDAVTCARPSVTAITSISFDHMEHLGKSLAEIAFEKAGILKPSVPVVVANQSPVVIDVIERHARKVGAPVRLEGRDFRFEHDADGKHFTYRGMRTSVPGLTLGLRGPHQVHNAAVALACLELLEDRGIQISQAHARTGLATAKWPGRLEEFAGPPLVVLDGAHNPGGMIALSMALDALYAGRKIHLVFGVLADKDHLPMLRTVLPKCGAAYLAPVASLRTLEPSDFIADARAFCPNVQAFESAEAAFGAARSAASPEDLVLVAGSLVLVGQIKAVLES